MWGIVGAGSDRTQAGRTFSMDKVRIMPKGHWYWSMPVPFSQGWKGWER